MSHEFDLMVKTMDLLDDTLAQNPRARARVDEAYNTGCPICAELRLKGASSCPQCAMEAAEAREER